MSRFTKKLYGSAFVNSFIAEMEGITHIHRPLAWIDTDGQRYSHIAGAIAMPTFEMPGYLLTIGIEFETETLHCLDEYETDSEIELIQRAGEISDEYGDALAMIYGDPSRLMPLTLDLQKPVLISHPVGSDLDDAFQLYVSRLQSSLMSTNKVLMLDGCNVLRNHIMAFTRDKAKQKDNPVVYAAGGLVHTLLTFRPWETARETVDLVPTLEDTAWINEQAEKEIAHQLYGGEQWNW
jgi:hypothetical protein